MSNRSRSPYNVQEIVATGYIRPGVIYCSSDPYRRAGAAALLQNCGIVLVINLGDSSHSYEAEDGVASVYTIRLCRHPGLPDITHQREEWLFVDFSHSLRPVLFRRISLWDKVVMSFVGLNHALLGGRRGAVDFYNEV
jgi:hypothetical protein